MPIRESKPGDPLTAETVNAIARGVESGVPLSLGGFGGADFGPGGAARFRPTPYEGWARLKSRTGGDYGWVALVPLSGGGWLEVGRVWLESENPAREAQDAEDVPTAAPDGPAIVYIYTIGNELRFQYGNCGS